MILRSGLFIAALWFLTGCSNLFFHPQKVLLRTPDSLGIAFDSLSIASSDEVQLHGWLLRTSQELQGTVLFFHGNAENISTHINSVYWLTEYGYQVVLVDYRGYGLSTGTPDIAGALNDVVFTARHVLQHNLHQDKPLFVLGQSLGASLAITAFAEADDLTQRIDGYVFEAAFADYQQITRDALSKSWLTWALQYPMSWTVTANYSPQDHIAALKDIPVLFIYSQQDEIIPFHHYRQLSDALDSEQSYLLESHDRHIRTFNYATYRTQLLQFLQNRAL